MIVSATKIVKNEEMQFLKLQNRRSFFWHIRLYFKTDLKADQDDVSRRSEKLIMDQQLLSVHDNGSHYSDHHYDDHPENG